MSPLPSGPAGHQIENDTPLGPRPASGVAAVTKATEVLHSFTALTRVLSLRRLAERTGIPRSTVHGLCVALEAAGLLERVPARGYRLGPALVELGGQVIDRTGLVEAAEGVLERVPRRDGTEAHLGQLVEGWIVYLDRAAGVLRAPMNNRVGLRSPAADTGCGRAALSLLDPAEVRIRVADAARSERRREPEPNETNVLDGELRLARKLGYIVSTSFQPGRLSVAAPVAAPDGTPVGGVSIAGPIELFSQAVLQRTAVDVMAAAKRIGERLPPRR